MTRSEAFIHFCRRYALMLSVFSILAGATVYYFYWHWKPFTQNAFLFANTRPVSPLVEGYLTEVLVRNNQFVRRGDPLFRVFRPPYTLRREQLQHEITAVRAGIAALDARIAAADSSVRGASAELANDRYLSRRADQMYEGAAVSQAYAEERLRSFQATEAKLHGAEHEKSALIHDKNAQEASLKKLQAAERLAAIYEEQTTVYALSDGYVTNLSVTPGGYYRPGDVLFGFVDTSQWWIQANFKENELSELRPGQKVRIWLWQYPEREFHGEVDHIGFSTERRRASPDTGLPVVEKENEWFLLPQRYPVQIRLIDPDPDCVLHVGGSAYAEIDIPARPIRQFFWQLFLWR